MGIQADKVEHMGCGRVLPGRMLLGGSVEAAAEKLSAAISAVRRSQAMKRNCWRMQSHLAAEDGIAAAATSIREALQNQERQFASKVSGSSCCHSMIPNLPRFAPDEWRFIQVHRGEDSLMRLPNGWEVHANSLSEAAFMCSEIFEEQCYLQHGITVRNGDIVVDVGANIGEAHSVNLTQNLVKPSFLSPLTTCMCCAGLFSVFLMTRDEGCRPAQIWAIEPLQPNLSLLHKNLTKFGLDEQVQYQISCCTVDLIYG